MAIYSNISAVGPMFLLEGNLFRTPLSRPSLTLCRYFHGYGGDTALLKSQVHNPEG